MTILGAIKRMLSPKGQEQQHFQKITPDEVELHSYQERERLDNVRKKLRKYRAQNDRDAIIGKCMLAEKGTILNAKNVFRQKNIFK